MYRRIAALSAAAMLVSLVGCAPREETGLSLRVCLDSATPNYDTIYAKTPGEQTILAHLYENLMRLERDGSGTVQAVPAAAKSVETAPGDDGGIVCTFRLRENKWSDGREVRASDFVYAWQRLADPRSGSDYAPLLSCIRGYEEARSTGDMSLLAVEAKNNNTLSVTLSGHTELFLTQVCTAVSTMPLRRDVVQRLKTAAEALALQLPSTLSAPRWCQDPTQLVTNGPYTADRTRPGAELVLKAAQPVQDGAAPEEIVFLIADRDTAWELYDAGQLDLVYPLSEAQIERLSPDDPGRQTGAANATECILFNCSALIDPSLRQAMSLSLDRTALSAAVSPAALPAEGLVPPGIPGGTGTFRSEGGALVSTDPEGYAQRCQEALSLLRRSGFDQSGDLAQMEYLYIDNEENAAVAKAVCQMWRSVLGLEVTPRGVEGPALTEALRSGNYTVAAFSVAPLSGDAECFLMPWVSDSADDLLHYENSAYDTLMSIIAGAEDTAARMGCLHDAEDLLIGMDHALSPLFHPGAVWYLRPDYTGAVMDPRGWFDFTRVTVRFQSAG